jgi:hypothetical protein
VREVSLQIPNKQWKYGEWVDYIINNKKDVFGSRKDRKLKVYYVHCTEEARDLLKKDSLDRGDFNLITMQYKESASKDKKSTEYWMHEKEPGLLMFFTASTKEGYEKTLEKKIEGTFGLHEMWIKPDSYEEIRHHLTVDLECGIAKFIASRTREDLLRHRVIEEAERHVQYRTSNFKDGVKRLDDFKQSLGIRPHSIDYVYKGHRLQITDRGLFHIKSVTHEVFDLMDLVLDKIRQEEREMRVFAQSLKFTKTSDNETPFDSELESGSISLSLELDINLAKEIITKFQKHFAFIDPKIERYGSLMFHSTVVERQKGSVFNISANKNSILLIPKYRTTFETFIIFYKSIVEQIDPNATWAKLSEIVESV